MEYLEDLKQKFIADCKKSIISILKNDNEVRKLAMEVLKENGAELNLYEKPISAQDLAKHFGCKVRTLDGYRAGGMPYLKGHPNKYLLSECITWYNTHRKMYRKVANR